MSGLEHLNERLQAYRAKADYRPCPFIRLVDSIPDEAIRNLLIETSDGDKVTTYAFYNELIRAGLSIGKESLMRHRKRGCSCYLGSDA